MIGRKCSAACDLWPLCAHDELIPVRSGHTVDGMIRPPVANAVVISLLFAAIAGAAIFFVTCARRSATL